MKAIDESHNEDSRACDQEQDKSLEREVHLGEPCKEEHGGGVQGP